MKSQKFKFVSPVGNIKLELIRHEKTVEFALHSTLFSKSIHCPAGELVEFIKELLKWIG
jgi:hypothetical protein